jgi:hypothetical protein
MQTKVLSSSPAEWGPGRRRGREKKAADACGQWRTAASLVRRLPCPLALLPPVDSWKLIFTRPPLSPSLHAGSLKCDSEFTVSGVQSCHWHLIHLTYWYLIHLHVYWASDVEHLGDSWYIWHADTEHTPIDILMQGTSYVYNWYILILPT